MVFHYSDFKVEIKNLKFTSDDGNRFPKTAIINFLDKAGKVSSVELMGYIPTEDIYDKIKRLDPINLDYCYVHNFSLSLYRDRNNLDKKSIIQLPEFSARNAFFDSKFGVDFSFAKFQDGDLSFEHTHFARGLVTFNTSEFGDGEVNFSNVLFREGELDFANSVFGRGAVLFKNSVIYDGKKDFQYADFGEGAVYFNNTEFHSGETSFINTHFGDGPVSFKIARFTSGKVDFHFAKFGEGDKSFERTEFGDSKVDFRTVEFGRGRVNFNRSLFGFGEVTFEASEIVAGRFSLKRIDFGKGSINFEQVDYRNSEVSFEKSYFGNGDITFFNSRFKNLSLKSCHLDHYLDLRVASCGMLDLSDSIARDIIDLQPHDFDIKLGMLDLSGMRLPGRLYLDWKENHLKELISEQEHTSIRQKAEQFRILKENFNITGKYTDEDKAYVAFKRNEALADLEDTKGSKPGRIFVAWLKYGFQWLIFDKMGMYATNPIRVLTSMLVGYLFFTFLYFFLMIFGSTEIVSSVGDTDRLSPLAVAFYHSAITFLTIGYGDYYPMGVIRIISGIEGFSGLFLMSYFTVAFVRKILR